MAPKGKAKTATKKAAEDDNGFRGAGVLASTKTARDTKIESFSLSAYGTKLVEESNFELTMGNRYGLIGRNGSGKSTFMKSIAARDVPIPDHIDIFLLENEAPATDFTPMQYVIDEANKEIERVEQEIEKLTAEFGADCEQLPFLYEKLDSMDPQLFEVKAGQILNGLGFDKKMLAKATKDMSGGWKMRVALARALFVKPALLLLDEPTNHLDLEACVWLENYLSHWERCLVVVSHSEDFMNGVCTHIIHLTPKKQLVTYGGNYDQFLLTKAENEVNQMKRFEKEQADIAHLKSFIASCGTYSNLVRQGKSKQKIIDKMEERGLTDKVVEEAKFSFAFNDCEKLPPPVIDINKVTFAYSGQIKDALYKQVELAVHSDSRVALVGPNGAGKSTLLKLISGELTPIEGEIRRHIHVRFGFYNQHICDVLDPEDRPLPFMMSTFGEGKQEEQRWRSVLGRFGITGPQQTAQIKTLSDGQKRRLMFAYLSEKKPNLLLLDEPTNHLDMETIDALADAVSKFNGGVLLVSHDFRLIEKVAKEVWLCDDKKVKPYKGDVQAYKKELVKKMQKAGLLD